MENSKRNNRGIEENTMAILDASGVKDAQDVDDDRLSFLEAVRASSIVPESGTAPTGKMLGAIFQILKDGKSLELTMASYQLLNALDKHFPRVYLSHSDKSKLSSTKQFELVVKEAWSPFVLGSEGVYSGREAAVKHSSEPLDSFGFHLLIQDIAQVANGANFQVFDTKPLGDMLAFQYLVNVLEGDFLPRNTAYRETKNWALLRESMLNMILEAFLLLISGGKGEGFQTRYNVQGSRRISYKSLIKDCVSIISNRCYLHAGFSLYDLKTPEESSAKTIHSCDAAVSIALVELGKGTCTAVQKLLVLIMELDMSKKQADMQGCTTRADGVRTPLVEIILDELTYNEDLLSPFFQAFSEPKWKLEMILQYFWKYITKPSVRTRRSNNSSEDATFGGVLKCFSNGTNTKSIIKKISTEVSQLLLAHAFQAYLSLQHSVEDIADSREDIGGSSVVQICESMISAFHNLRRMDEDVEIMPLAKEALFTAATILSTKS
ncbi:hypothetical protein HHK36_001791 [Tetracentron sinense]|uniref:Negative regulator of systemic acquired resistance SNI1 n=1 Tax=Tetracentron sinense TaxID=13715 RepID=A0A834ZYQ4_TETSI|nr:hypothetical protein HHK36_001791 [Tetracentron sinense]